MQPETAVSGSSWNTGIFGIKKIQAAVVDASRPIRKPRRYRNRYHNIKRRHPYSSARAWGVGFRPSVDNIVILARVRGPAPDDGLPW